MIYPHDDGPEFGTVNHNQITISPNCDLQSMFGCINSSVDGIDINYATEPLEIVGGYVNHGKRVIDYICKTKSHRIIIKCQMLMDKYQWPQGMVVGHGERSRFTVNIINEGSDRYSRVSFIRLGDAHNYANQDHIVEKVSVSVWPPLHDVDTSPLPDGLYINSVHQRVATYHDEASLVIIFNEIRSGRSFRTTNEYSLKIPLRLRPDKIGPIVTRLNDFAINRCAIRFERRDKCYDRTLRINTLKGYETDDIVFPESIQFASPMLRTGVIKNGTKVRRDVYKETFRDYSEAFERYFHGV
jgi:hypothetical protein